MATLLVLGAKSDIARAVAHRFARSGFDLLLAARTYEDGEADARDMEIRYGIKASAVEIDALDFGSHQSFYEGLKEKPLGIICAVGYLGDQKKAEHDFAEVRKITETNYSGCVSALDVIADDFEKRKEGFIIGISSAAGERGRQSNYFYGSAKAAFTSYLSGLRNRLHKAGVRVVTVKPGFVRTAMTENMDLPTLLTASPEDAAEDIFNGWKKGKDVVYTRWYWKYIMFIIRNIPERIFKKLSL